MANTQIRANATTAHELPLRLLTSKHFWQGSRLGRFIKKAGHTATRNASFRDALLRRDRQKGGVR